MQTFQSGPVPRASEPISTVPAIQPFDHRMAPADLTEFRATLDWQSRSIGHTCASSPPEAFPVVTWYLHSVDRTRTEESRTVRLAPQPQSWHHDIIERWRDLLDPDHPVQLHVVTPNPPGDGFAHALHVIVVQRPNPLWRAALLTVSNMRPDPWHIAFVCAMLDSQTSLEQLGFISGVTHSANPDAPGLTIEASHGSVEITTGTFPVRNGFWFDIQALALPPTEDETASLLQLSFRAIKRQIKDLQAVNEEHLRACMMDQHSAHRGHANEVELSVAVSPNSPGQYRDSCDAISFFSALQAFWQPLAVLQPPALPALVPVVTWYIDHVRFPQCFQPRLVLLNLNPEDWLQRIRSVWIDLIQPQHLMHVHVVQPAPVDMPAHVAAHLLIVQQPVQGFKSVLITCLDSGHPHAPVSQHATLAPSPVAFNTVLALAYHEVICHQYPNECAAWVGNQELQPGQDLPLINGHSLIVALHRHALPIQDGDLWEPPAPAGAAAPHSKPEPPHSSCTQGRRKETGPPACLHSVQVPCPGYPVLLQLDAVLPCTRPTPTQEWSEALSTLAWSDTPDWIRRVRASLEVSLSPVPSSLHMTDPTMNAVHEAMEAPIGPYETIEIYVDGATSTTHASWSLVVVAHACNAQRLLGTLAGPVILPTHHACWFGAHTVDNIAAELSALAAALAVTLQCQFPCPVHIRPDLSLSRLIAQELVTTSSNPQLAKLCRVMANWVPSSTKVIEVRGHTYHPWNDLADSLAKHVLFQPDLFPPVSFGELHNLVKTPHDLEWAWTQSTPTGLKHCLPNLVDSTIWQFPPSSRRTTHAKTPPGASPEPTAFQCKVATINVLALDRTDSSTEIGRRKGARTLRLDNQLHTAGFHMVGLQETRTPEGQQVTEHYQIISSGVAGAAAERSGCELWFHRNLPIMYAADQRPISLANCHYVVAHADPRRLFVNFEHQTFQLSVAVLHAPCLGKSSGNATAPIDVLKQWWADTAAVWAHAVRHSMTCVFIDANATLATGATDFFHMHQADSTTPQTALFEEFLIDHHLYVPSTFEALHTGPSYTWTHSSGKRMRLDYVLLSRALFEMVNHSSTWRSYDGTFAHEDHIPAVLGLSGWILPTDAKERHRWDEAALLCPERCYQFQQALATLPIPPWEVQVDDHCRLYEAQYLQLAKQFFTQKKGVRRRPPLSTTTLDAIAFKRHVLDCGRNWGLMTDQAGPARPLPMLKTTQGSTATSFRQQQEIWFNQFSKVEAGLSSSLEGLQSKDACPPDLPLDLQEAALFPTEWQLQATVAKLKRGRVPGPNGLTPCILKAGGSTFAKQFLTLTTKTVAHAKEPTSWKGGKLVPLYKGKDSTVDPASYRAIYISDHTSKIYHRLLRQHLEIPWSTDIDLLQMGGRKKVGTDLAHHMLEAHQFWCRTRRLPSAVVFFDLRAAFYSVLRQALLETSLDPTMLRQALETWQVPERLIQIWLDQAQKDHAILGATPHAERLIHDCMNNTFFTVDGVEGVCCTTRGTRPGDPLGDLLFNLIMRLVLHDMHETIQATTQATWIGAPEHCDSFAHSTAVPSHAYFDVSFVDDAAVAVHAESLNELEHTIKRVVEAFHQAAAIRGLDVNFSKGKTEVLWNFIGKGSKALKERLHDAGQWLHWEAEGSSFSLRVSHAYKHLGSWMQIGGHHQRECMHRAALALQSWGSLARSFYHKRYVSLASKTRAFQSLSMSRLMFNAHTWVGVKEDQLDHWQQKLRKPLGLMTKQMLRGIAPVKIDTADLFALAQILPPKDQLHVARLRYLKRLLSYCPQTLWNMLFQAQDHPDNWLALCASSFEWFLQFYQVPGAPKDTHDLPAWLAYVALDSNWKGRLKKAAKGCLLFRTATTEENVWLKAFKATFESAGGVVPCTQTTQAETWVCDQCQKTYPSKRALATHAGRAHGYRRLVKFYAIDTTCNACAKVYATRKRLIEHLRDATECLQTLQACFPPLPDEEVIALDAADQETTLALRAQGWGPAKALAPARKIYGPTLPAAGSSDATDMLHKWTSRVPVPGSGFSQLQGHAMTPNEASAPEVILFADDFPAFVYQSRAGPNQGGWQILRTRPCSRDGKIAH